MCGNGNTVSLSKHLKAVSEAASQIPFATVSVCENRHVINVESSPFDAIEAAPMVSVPGHFAEPINLALIALWEE